MVENVKIFGSDKVLERIRKIRKHGICMCTREIQQCQKLKE